jgi:hypothetical protein
MKRFTETKLLRSEAQICYLVDKQIICKLPHLQGLVTTYLLLPESFPLFNCHTMYGHVPYIYKGPSRRAKEVHVVATL